MLEAESCPRWKVIAEEELLQGLNEKTAVIQRALAQAYENASIMSQASLYLHEALALRLLVMLRLVGAFGRCVYQRM